jgi:FkbM family methyltransferase
MAINTQKTMILKFKNLIYKMLSINIKQLLLFAVFVKDFLRPYIRHIKYQGFTLVYSKGTSLVEVNGNPTVRFGGVYEPRESLILANWLSEVRDKEPIFLDIGANIGLMSLNVLSSVPDTKIYAFEPGEHQNFLLGKTIQTNNLEQKITLYKQALSKESGKGLFAVHKTQDCSGDGLFDTLRAGEVNTIEVELNTLDDWWQSVGCPLVDVMKIDTEGAELWILQGGEKMIQSCKPKVLMEINATNLNPYPYSPHNILSWLNGIEYSLQSLSGIPVNADNLKSSLLDCENFKAIPFKS